MNLRTSFQKLSCTNKVIVAFSMMTAQRYKKHCPAQALHCGGLPDKNNKTRVLLGMCASRNIHSSSQKVKGNSKGVGEGGGGHLKSQNFKGKYEAKKEFPEEGGFKLE